MTTLSKSQLKHLRGLCHDLKPVVMLGQKGLTDEVLNELDNALDHHELVKVKLASDDREIRQQLITMLCEKSNAVEVQSIGKTVSLYRQNPKKPVISLPR